MSERRRRVAGALLFVAIVVLPFAKAADMRSEWFQEWWRQLAVVAAVAWLPFVVAPWNEWFRRVGFRRPTPGTGWWVAGLAAAAVVVPVAAAVLRDSVTPNQMWTLAFVTGLGEELLYRGVLLAVAVAVLPDRRLEAHVVIAIGFVFWHAGNVFGKTADTELLWLLAALGDVVGTTAGAIAFGWLRDRTDTLAAPTFFHIAFNALVRLVSNRAA